MRIIPNQEEMIERPFELNFRMKRMIRFLGNQCIRAFFLLLFCLNNSLFFAQDFQKETVILRQKTIAKSDSLSISVRHLVIATNNLSSNGQERMTPVSGFIIRSDYWLFWNNACDSIQIPISSRKTIVEDNFKISFRKLQNKADAVILEYSRTDDPTFFTSDARRVFQIIDLNTRRKVLDKEFPEITFQDRTEKGDGFESFDVFRQRYELTFEENDDVTITHTGAWVKEGLNGVYVKSKSTIPKQIFKFTYHKDGSIWYKKT